MKSLVAAKRKREPEHWEASAQEQWPSDLCEQLRSRSFCPIKLCSETAVRLPAEHVVAAAVPAGGSLPLCLPTP
eukprot:1511596-Rhodomonas_salina.1